jgi:predicted RNA binding protein YcfA (HicA-like mRNA interferase family)
VVPVHAGETIGPGLLQKVLRACNLTVEDLKNLL